MRLNEQISRIKSVMGITESKIVDGIQGIIDSALQKLKDETIHMGLGEMDELDEIESVDKIKVTNFVNDEVPVLYVDFMVNSNRRDFDNINANMEYEVGKYVPNVQIINKIIDTRTFGSGIDW